MKKFISLLFYACVLIIGCISASCTPESEAQIITQYSTDTVVVTTTEYDTVYMQQWDTVFVEQVFSDTLTTIIITRHAEKLTTGSDPGLTPAGIDRANRLSKMFENVEISTAYSTNLNRAKQTIQPLAQNQGIEITLYGTSPNYNQLTQQFVNENLGKTAIVSGHSNTVPSILSAFTNGEFQISIDESDYENLFIVTVPKQGEGSVKVMHLKY